MILIIIMIITIISATKLMHVPYHIDLPHIHVDAKGMGA